MATSNGGIRPLDVPTIPFKLNRRLLTCFYQWTGRALKLIRKIPATMEKKFE